MPDKRIIIVDDALELGRLLKATLNTLNRGLEVVVVPSAEEAMLETEKGVELLVTDYKLPGISGSELVKKVRTRQPGVKVIMISGLADDQIPQAARDLQVDFRLKKPMEIEEFLAAAKKCLELSKNSAEGAPQDGSEIMGSRIKTVLDRLTGDLNATATCLIDESGEVLSRTGAFPDRNFEARWIPAVLSAVTADSKILQLFPTSIGDGLHAYMGTSFHLIFISVVDDTLIAVLKPEQGYSHLLMSIGVVIDAQRDLIKVMTGKAADTPAARPAPKAEAKQTAATSEKTKATEESPKEDTSEFAARLGKAAPKMADADLDKFWEEPAEAEKAGGEGLTYEEAQKKGYLKGEGKEKRK